MNKDKALVILSGGQDSATCLKWAVKHFEKVCAISFYYGQRHWIETNCAKKLCKELDVPWEEVNVRRAFDVIEKFSALTNPELKDISKEHCLNKELPASFVPGRNLLFLTFAAQIAYTRNIHHLVTGVCQTDYSGYPDCRHEFISSIQTTLTLALQYPITIHAPLMFLTKAETVKFMQKMGGLHLYKYTHTCYNGKVPPCGECPSCKLRAKGFAEAGIKDPLLEG